MHKRKRQEAMHAVADLKNEVFHLRNELTDKEKNILKRNIRSIEKTLDAHFYTI
jgi:predicted  nucleic acid-binding Zn-ribbon protein